MSNRNARHNINVNVNVPPNNAHGGQRWDNERRDPDTLEEKDSTVFWMKMIFGLIVLAGLAYMFPMQALWIASKLFGAAAKTTQVAGTVAIKTAETIVEKSSELKDAAEAEYARRVIVKEALAALTPCSLLRCTSEMENIVQLIGSLKQAQHNAAMQAEADMCSPIMPSDEAGRLLLATAAPWLIQQPQGRLPRSECTTTIGSYGDMEETCKYETTLKPCSNAVKWPDLASTLEEPLKIFNQNLADRVAKQKAQLMRMISAPESDDVQGGLATTGELSTLMQEVLGDSSFAPAGPRRSTVRVVPYQEESEAQVKASGGKTVVEKMEVLREDQKLEPKTRFCRHGSVADSTAQFCKATTKLTKERLLKAIEVIKKSQNLKIAR